MEDEEFSKYIDEAVIALPKEFKDKLDNVSIIVEDYPSTEQLKKLNLRHNTLLLGLYEGIPQTRRGVYGIGLTLPDKITIFKLPILAIARSKEQTVAIIKNTVRHEIAHHFGLSEERVRRAEASRKSQ